MRPEAFDAANVPVNCGGVLVRPADFVVADGARKILDDDKAGRRKLYQQRGLPLDSTVT